MKELVVTAEKVSLLGIDVHAVTMQVALDIIEHAIDTRQQLQIGVVNAAKLVNMRRDANLQADVAASNLILADGIAVVWASKLLRRPLPERVAGIDLMMGMLERGNRKGHAVYCLGASEEISKRVETEVRRLFPNVRFAGRHHGYFSEADEAGIVADIATSRPDFLLVAMTSPKKEKFIAKHIQLMGVPVCHGVGGSFDVLAGKVARAPILWQRLGLEWLYRLKQEPGRLWRRYLTTNTIFCAMVLSELCRGFFGTRRDNPLRKS